MLDNLYLIAHKVRGEPAFDIAERCACPICEGTGTRSFGAREGHDCDCDGGWWWMSRTWGWRAYPYQTWHLLELLAEARTEARPMPEDATDIFEQSDDARKMSGADLAEGQSLLLQLGLAKPKDPINRRGI